MGVSLNSMTGSSQLRELVDELDELDECGEYLNDAADMTSTRGYDNDGSTGPELVDNGVALAFEARDYSPEVVIFFAYGTDTCYYVFGHDEADAIRRFRIGMSDTEEGREMLRKTDES